MAFTCKMCGISDKKKHHLHAFSKQKPVIHVGIIFENVAMPIIFCSQEKVLNPESKV